MRLVAVSKTKPALDVRVAYDAGQRDFGENYVQELIAKAEALADLTDLRFHFIGHLQRNKAKLVTRIVSAVHTVDSVKLAQELGKRAAESPDRKRLVTLVEVNVGGEGQKSGCAPSELGKVMDAIERRTVAPTLGFDDRATIHGGSRWVAAFFRRARRARGNARRAVASPGTQHGHDPRPRARDRRRCDHRACRHRDLRRTLTWRNGRRPGPRNRRSSKLP